jgi:hypothetical protein
MSRYMLCMNCMRLGGEEHTSVLMASEGKGPGVYGIFVSVHGLKWQTGVAAPVFTINAQ